MSSPPSFQDMFFEECQELLEALAEGLNDLQDEKGDAETVNSVFRAVHSIKGGAGAFDLGELVDFSHVFETVLDELRSGNMPLSPELTASLLRASDFLSDLISAAQSGVCADTGRGASIIAELHAYINQDAPEEDIFHQPLALQMPDLATTLITYHISFRPHARLYQNGHDPLFLLQALAQLGETRVTIDENAIPHLGDFNCKEAYLSWHIDLVSDAPQGAVEQVFEFVQGLCDLSIAAQNDAVAACAGAANPRQSDNTLVTPSDISPQPGPDDDVPPRKPDPRASLRVDPDRVDRLINTVGELIINQSTLTQSFLGGAAPNQRDIEAQLEEYKMLARDLQEEVMAIRAQPVKPLFQRMSRIVREAASATGKSARLILDGEDTEVDKSLIERLADPLTHMIRNAVDHGLESPEGRQAAFKDDVGEIRLRAAHRSGSVYISISDDGAGLNRQKIHDTAVAKNLIPSGAELEPEEIDNLLFLPGFSTSNEVSNLSGRGVGMDVVKNAVTSLGGRISIHSEPGEGTTFSITLPLTLAVMDGMVIRVANETMVVPIASVLETVQPDPAQLFQLSAEGPVYAVRGKYVPIIDVAWNLALSEAPITGVPDVLLLVETETFGRCALAIDDICDQRQVVIKSLDGVYSVGTGVSAATILGDGKIAMIIDIESIVQIDKASSGKPRPIYDQLEAENELAS